MTQSTLETITTSIETVKSCLIGSQTKIRHSNRRPSCRRSTSRETHKRRLRPCASPSSLRRSGTSTICRTWWSFIRLSKRRLSQLYPPPLWQTLSTRKHQWTKASTLKTKTLKAWRLSSWVHSSRSDTSRWTAPRHPLLWTASQGKSRCQPTAGTKVSQKGAIMCWPEAQ